jgi:hypothetical protein
VGCSVPVAVDGIEGAYFPGRHGPTQPEIAAIQTFEAGLREYVIAQLGRDSQIARCLDAYARQYRVADDHGRRTLAAFFLCDGPESWQRREVSVQDDPACYFDVDFDPRTRRYESSLR